MSKHSSLPPFSRANSYMRCWQSVTVNHKPLASPNPFTPTLSLPTYTHYISLLLRNVKKKESKERCSSLLSKCRASSFSAAEQQQSINYLSYTHSHRRRKVCCSCSLTCEDSASEPLLMSYPYLPVYFYHNHHDTLTYVFPLRRLNS